MNAMNAGLFVQTMITLASASLGLVAALAWNEAIRATIERLAGGDGLAGLYVYAVLATLIAVVVLLAGGADRRRGGDHARSRGLSRRAQPRSSERTMRRSAGGISPSSTRQNPVTAPWPASA